MDKDKQPGISFDSIMLVKENFWRGYNVPEESEPKLEFGLTWNIENNKYVVGLSTTLKLIHEEAEVLVLENEFIGLFSIIECSPNMDIEQYVKNNSAALMFPYVREHISAITQKSGVKPVLLPPINVLALVKNLDK